MKRSLSSILAIAVACTVIGSLCYFFLFPTTASQTVPTQIPTGVASVATAEVVPSSPIELNPVLATQASLWSRDGQDWPRMLGPLGNSLSLETGLLTEWPKQPPIVWTLDTGIGYGNGVVANGRWFQFDRFQDKERLSCVHAETGQLLWKWEAPVSYEDMYGYNNGPRCSPVVEGDQVYCYGVNGRLACLNSLSGELLWQVDTNAKYGVIPNFFGVGSTPLVHKNLVITMVGGSPDESRNVGEGQLHLVKPNGTGIVAFHRETGEEVYRVGNYLSSYSAPILANLEGKVWCLAFMREGLMVFDPDTGIEADFFRWRSKTIESVNAASPIVLGDEILLSETYEIGSVRLRFANQKLTEVWRDKPNQKYQMMRAHWSTPIAIGDQIYGCSGRNEPDADMRCVDWKSGEVRWEKRTRERSSLLQIEGHIFVLCEHGELLLLKINPDKMEQVAAYDFEQIPGKNRRPLLEYPVWAPPVYSHGYLYLRGARTVVCLDMRKK